MSDELHVKYNMGVSVTAECGVDQCSWQYTLSETADQHRVDQVRQRLEDEAESRLREHRAAQHKKSFDE